MDGERRGKGARRTKADLVLVGIRTLLPIEKVSVAAGLDQGLVLAVVTDDEKRPISLELLGRIVSIQTASVFCASASKRSPS